MNEINEQEEFDYDAEKDAEYEELYEMAENCTCCAYGVVNGQVFHVSNCIWGAE